MRTVPSRWTGGVSADATAVGYRFFHWIQGAPRLVHTLPSGTCVTILDDSSSDSMARIRTEQGGFRAKKPPSLAIRGVRPSNLRRG